MKIFPEFSNKKEHALKVWYYTFLKNNDFVIRKALHIGQALPVDYENKIIIFLKEIISKRKLLNINDNNLDSIINVDETPLYFDAPFDTTIEKKGIKEVKINTSGYEKERLSILLSITDSGKKLIPIIIFKGQQGKKIQQNLVKHPLVKKKLMKIFCQPNVWFTYEIFKYWIKEIFLDYQYKSKKNVY